MRCLATVLFLGLLRAQSVSAADPFPIQTPPAKRMPGFAVTLEESTPTLVWCPAGKFTMGSPESEEHRSEDENQVQVKFSHGFWIGRDEVTQAQWRAVMHTAPWQDNKAADGLHIPEHPQFPATCVSWQDALDFCEKLTERERKAGRLTKAWKYTLPTEAQWEYACRAGTTTAYCFGDDAETELPYQFGDAIAEPYIYLNKINRHAWYNWNVMHTFAVHEDQARPHTQKVRWKEPNAWGIHDMHGNVWEWCLDWYQEKLPGGTDPVVSKRPDQQDAVTAGPLSLDSTNIVLAAVDGKVTEPADEGPRVIRGGSWRTQFVRLRSANRDALTPTVRADHYGFRVVLVPAKP